MLLTMMMTAAAVSTLSPGQPLPPLQGEFLTGRKAVLPAAASGRVALVALGFTYDSRFAVEAWVNRFRKDFGANPRLTFFEVPMIAGLARLGKWFIDGGMRRGTPRQAPDAAYLILLDQRGIVRWRHSGSFDEPAYQALTNQLPALLGEQP
jgi:hypothetical protein